MFKRLSLISLIIFILTIIINVLICSAVFSEPENYNVTSDFNQMKKLSQDEMVVIIVDFSESMNEYMGHKTKMQVAMENLSSILPYIPQNIRVGLRVYGHKDSAIIYKACTASDLVVVPQANSAAKISDALYALKPRGVTPITYSLKQCIANDFIGYGGKKHIVLISDGKENCDESPCKFAIEMMKTRDDVVIDVIALGIDDPEAISQLKCAALTTSGKFYKSNTAAELRNSLRNSLNAQKEVQGQIILK